MEDKKIIPVTFFGDLTLRGYEISYLLLDRQIKHDFVIIAGDFLLAIHKIRDIHGYERIRRYLEEYQFVVDLWI